MSLSNQKKMSLSQFASNNERDGLITGLIIWLIIIVVFAPIIIYIIFDRPRFSDTEGFINNSEQRWIVVNNSDMPIEIQNYNVTRNDDGFYNSHYDIIGDEPVNKFEIEIIRYDSWHNRYVEYETTEIINPEKKSGSFEKTWGYYLNEDVEYTHMIYIKKVMLQSGEVFRWDNPPLNVLE